MLGLFFVWYSTNVFLTKKKKEIGIYAFMGLANERIGKLYMIETVMTGMMALILGIGVGALTARLFQMIMVELSGITVEVFQQISFRSALIVSVCYVIIYVIFVVKGYVNIVRSSVLEMISASRKNEFVRQHPAILLVKTILGIAALAAGFAMKERYEGMVHFRNTYTYQVLSPSAGKYEEFAKRILKENEIVYGTEISMVQLEQPSVQSRWKSNAYSIIPYSKVKMQRALQLLLVTCRKVQVVPD